MLFEVVVVVLVILIHCEGVSMNRKVARTVNRRASNENRSLVIIFSRLTMSKCQVSDVSLSFTNVVQ